MAYRKILLVEGTDDEHVLKHICGARGGLRFDAVERYGGAQELLEALPVRLKASEEGDIVGVVVDADTDLASRWRAVRDRLVQLGYVPASADPAAEGTVVDPPTDALLPRVGIWLMPDNRTNGILEDFLRFLVPAESHLFDYVVDSVADIPETERRFSEAAKPKVLIYTWLAWQSKPGRPLGTAITARFLDPDASHADGLVAWLHRLYNP